MSVPAIALGTAPAKLILFGEHSVVHGQPALGVALSRGVKVTLRRGTGQVHVRMAEGLAAPAKGPRATPEALVKAALGTDAGDIDAEIELNVPPVAGLGSSAAIAVALLRARQILSTRPAKNLLRAAMSVEDLAHGRSSGLDPAICLTGGLVEFLPARSTGGAKGRPRIRRLTPSSSFHLVVGVLGTHGGTEGRMQAVASTKEELPVVFDRAMSTLGALCRAGTRALMQGELATAGRAMDLAHGVLSGFGLVSDGVETLVRSSRAHGALGAKMSGAGGDGGAFFALAPDIRAAHRIHHVLELGGARTWIETAAE